MTRLEFLILRQKITAQLRTETMRLDRATSLNELIISTSKLEIIINTLKEMGKI